MATSSTTLVELNAGDFGLRRRFETMPRKMFDELHRSLKNYGNDFVRIMKERRLSKPEISDDGLRKRTGNTSRALNSEMAGTALNDLTLTIFFRRDLAPGARVHEYGAGGSGILPPIRPTKSKYLAIPLDAVLTATGVARGGPREVAQEYDRTFVRPSKRNSANKVIFGVKNGVVTPLFALVPEVIIKARLGFRKTHDQLAPARREYFRRTLAKIAERF